ncbi:MAG TPA: chemotaxis protein CheB [Stellaceae bacterium]|nr:chemotaxis protein CheB [Stellaceae bacterium]
MARRQPKEKLGGKRPAPKRVKAAPPRRRRPSAPPLAAAAGPLVVALGASAGGLDAFKGFLANMPAKSRMALVLVQHLYAHHKSLLVELLSKRTEIPVVQAEHGMAVAPDRVFVIPPNAVLTIERGTLPLPRRRRRASSGSRSSIACNQLSLGPRSFFRPQRQEPCEQEATCPPYRTKR